MTVWLKKTKLPKTLFVVDSIMVALGIGDCAFDRRNRWEEV